MDPNVENLIESSSHICKLKDDYDQISKTFKQSCHDDYVWALIVASNNLREKENKLKMARSAFMESYKLNLNNAIACSLAIQYS